MGRQSYEEEWSTRFYTICTMENDHRKRLGWYSTRCVRVDWVRLALGSSVLFSPLPVASGMLSIPWFRWPTRLSHFESTSRSVLNDTTKMENRRCSAPDPCPTSPEPRGPSERRRDSRETLDEIHRLMQNPILYDPLRAPRYPIVLCHGVCLASAALVMKTNEVDNTRVVRL
jgi:hypothetical protein